MNTDRELLELAAKATGIVLMWSQMEDLSPRRADNMDIWNPLTDDGDALRLAVKLNILELSGAELGMSYNQVGDDYANARHAIVWIAAEIGKAMP